MKTIEKYHRESQHKEDTYTILTKDALCKSERYISNYAGQHSPPFSD